MNDRDAELEKPYRESCPTFTRGVSPRRPIVDEERLRQAVAAEGQFQATAHRIAALIGASLQAQIVARMIVHYRQWMALRVIAKPHPALEVHLPQQIRCRLLKALAGHGASNRRLARAAQDLMHRRNRRRVNTLAFQAPCNLASSPRRVSIAYRKNAPFKFVVGPLWARMRTARSVPESLICLPSAEPFITRVRVDTEPAAKLPPVHSLLHR